LIESLRGATDPHLEIWVCDDHSTDGTTEWLQAHAAEYGIRWFRGQRLPDGWTGKNWACFQLAQHARNEWLLFLDADMVCQPGFVAAVREAIACHSGAALITAIPTFRPASWAIGLLKAMLPFSIFSLLPLPLAERSPNPAFAFANGQLLLMPRDLYMRWEPHRAVRGEVLEDVAIAALVKRKGGLVTILDGRSLMQVSMYRTLGEAVAGLAKNAVAICRHRIVVVVVALMLLLCYGVPLLLMGRGSAFWEVRLALIESVLLFGGAARMTGMSPLYGLGYPLSVALGLWTLLRSAIWYHRGQVEWKGRSYRVFFERSGRVSPMR
jgi:hypothetical protein